MQVCCKYNKMALSEKQNAFARAFADGANQAQAARIAGYASTSNTSLSVQGCRLARDPQVQRAVHNYREARLSGPMASKALSCLESVMDDTAAPPAARLQAARWILEAAGHGVAAQSLQLRAGSVVADRPMSDWSLAELEAMVAQREGELEGLRPVSARSIEVGSSQPIDCEVVTD